MVILAAGYRGTDKLSAAIEAERPNIELHVIGDVQAHVLMVFHSGGQPSGTNDLIFRLQLYPLAED